MPRALTKSWLLLAAALLCMLPLWVHSEVVDKIVAVVDGKIITQSDLKQERAARAVLEEDAPTSDKELLAELVERKIIISQLSEFRGVEASSVEIERRVEEIKDRQGLPRDALVEAIHTRMQIAAYLDVRFRQFVQVSDEDVRRYYRDVFAPEAAARGMNPIPSIEDVTEGIRKNVIEEKVDRDLSVWLETVRRRSEVEIFE